jgi:hypothetical protein
MLEFIKFRSDRAPITNWLGHQVTKAVCAGSAALEKKRDPDLDYKHTYNLILLQEQKYDFIRGNAIFVIALLTAAIISNYTK